MVGVDPAKASLEVAHAKPGSAAVTWIHGDATTLPRDVARIARQRSALLAVARARHGGAH